MKICTLQASNINLLLQGNFMVAFILPRIMDKCRESSGLLSNVTLDKRTYLLLSQRYRILIIV